MNELLFLFTFIAVLSLVLFSFRMGHKYVYAFIATIGTLAFFLSPMIISIFGFPLSLTELFYAALFFTTDVISEHYGTKDAHGVIWLAVVVSITIGILTTIATLFHPHAIDLIQPNIKAILAISPRILIAAFVMFIIEQHFDIWLFHKIKERTQEKKLWLRNNLGTIVTQLIDVLVFYPLAFYGVYPHLLQLMVVAFVFKIVLALIDTPFIYLSYHFKPKTFKESLLN